MPPPNGLDMGIPTGQPNSTVLMSSPMRFLSSVASRFNQSRTGYPPASVRKKIAGALLPWLSNLSDCSFCPAGGLVRSPTEQAYHIRYNSAEQGFNRSYPLPEVVHNQR